MREVSSGEKYAYFLTYVCLLCKCFLQVREVLSGVWDDMRYNDDDRQFFRCAIYIYTCVYVCVYVYILYMNMYLCIHIHVYMYTYHICIFIYVCVYV